MLGVVNVVPVPNEEPPELAAYQLIVPPLAAPNVNVPASQRESGVVPLMVGVTVTVTVGVVDKDAAQLEGAIPVTRILKVIVADKLPVGKLMLPPVPTTEEPMSALFELFLN